MDKPSARGRNGWFKPAQIEVWRSHGDGLVRVWVWSKRGASIAPVILNLTAADAANLSALLKRPPPIGECSGLVLEGG